MNFNSYDTLDTSIISAGEFCHLELPPQEFLLTPWLKKDSINLMSGWRGTGKTWFVLGIVNAVNTGQAFGPWHCEKPVKCLFLDGEMTAGDVQQRLKALMPSPNDNLQVYCDALVTQQGMPRAHLGNEHWRARMKNILLEHGIKLWVVDNIASLSSGINESSKSSWDPINQWLIELRFAGISTILLHHVNKKGGQRGTSAREDNLDCSLMLKPPKSYLPEQGTRFIVEFTKKRVSTQHLHLMGKIEFRLEMTLSGQYEWKFETIQQDRRDTIIEMLHQGIRATDIAKELGVTKGYVSQIKKKAMADAPADDTDGESRELMDLFEDDPEKDGPKWVH